jgi:hypothetical protein
MNFFQKPLRCASRYSANIGGNFLPAKKMTRFGKWASKPENAPPEMGNWRASGRFDAFFGEKRDLCLPIQSFLFAPKA